ncbi:MAG TPA: hypothetical protein VM940_08180 [Chthoniobacterales bacterium]|jgi:hypothetical protein|nr:hypothetical protein [Chthoniobacterales bacterium]
MKIFPAAIALVIIAFSPASVRAETVKVENFTFTVPDGWRSVTPSSSMRKAQLEVARGPEKAEVTFFHFGADQGGSAADNVARWFAQFSGGEQNRVTENATVGAVKITFAMTEGTFNSGMPGGPTTPMHDYALCGAIMESASGSVFIKMTGPKTVVQSATDAFKKMVTEAAKAAPPKA